MGFSIIIPSWNNLPYLRFCIESILKNSSLKHQIIVHVNEGTDGTPEWLKSQGLAFTFSKENIGVCKAVNQASIEADKDHILFMNDDMFVLPKWDQFLQEAIDQLASKQFMLSATMIEPKDTGNPCVIVAYYGDSIETFKKKELLNANLEKQDWSGASWPPVLIPKELWQQVGGMSEEFSPGMYSDPDLSMKLWQAGCRIFKGVGKSHVYHFQCKTTGKITRNDGRKQFLKKWGILPSVFYKYYLRMGEKYEGALDDPRSTLSFKTAQLRSKLLSYLA